jgi:formylmethanofuran dehydrogenase subunit C
MKGGTIEILGDAGHLIGAAYRGASVGMRGGNLIVHGSCGNEVGSHMRRGLIAIGKNVGDFVGMGMIAGTIITAGSVGIRAGAEMKRGTLVFLSERPALLPTFRFSCNYDPAFLTIYFNKLKQFNFPLLNTISPWSRYCGDLISLGRGEILCKAN